MKIFVDENIPSRTVEELRGLGHDVLDIRGTDVARSGLKCRQRAGRRISVTLRALV